MSQTEFQAALAKGRSQMIKVVPKYNQLRQRRYANPKDDQKWVWMEPTLINS